MAKRDMWLGSWPEVPAEILGGQKLWRNGFCSYKGEDGERV